MLGLLLFNFFNKMKHIIFAIVLLCLFIGCNEQKLPSDMPELIQCTVTVIQDGKPLPDATVVFQNTDVLTRFVVGGRTDAKGVAVIRTDARYDGAPAGNYKIGVSKIEVSKIPLPARDAPDYAAKMKEIENDTFQCVDKKFVSPSDSGLTISVASPKAEAQLDVGSEKKTVH